MNCSKEVNRRLCLFVPGLAMLQIGKGEEGSLALGLALASGGSFPGLAAGIDLDGKNAVMLGSGNLDGFIFGDLEAVPLGIFLQGALGIAFGGGFSVRRVPAG